MLTRAWFLVSALPALLAACSSTAPVRPTPDGGSDTTQPDQAQPDQAPPDQGNPDQTLPDGGTDLIITEPLAATQSFVVHGQLTLTPAQGGNLQPLGPLPTTQDFVVRIDPVGKTLISGTPGQASRSALRSDDGRAFEVIGDLTFRLPTTLCSASVRYVTFKFAAGPNAVAGSATGDAWLIQGDVAFQYAARLDFTGVPDTQGPSLNVPAAGLDPLRGLPLSASEPLPAHTTAHLATGTDTVNLNPLLPTGSGVVSGFDMPAIALRYGTTYDVIVDPWADLAGNAGVATAKVTTAPLPPVAAEDGFEGSATVIGGATVVDATLLPPINGLKSVVLTAAYGSTVPLGGVRSTRLSVRLAVNSGDRFVRFSLRAFGVFQSPSSTYNTSMVVAVPGGAVNTVPLPPNEETGTQQPNPSGGNPIWMGDVRTVEVPLPAGASNEVVFDVTTSAASFSCGLPPPTVSYLLDDLRVE